MSRVPTFRITGSRFTIVASAAIVLTLAFAGAADAQQQPDPNSPRYKGVVALQEFLDSVGDEAVGVFMSEKLAGSVHESMEHEALFNALKGLREEAAEGQMRGAMPSGPLGAEIVFDMDDGASFSIEFEMSEADNSRFALIRSPMVTIGG